jgi:hypothetical protein
MLVWSFLVIMSVNIVVVILIVLNFVVIHADVSVAMSVVRYIVILFVAEPVVTILEIVVSWSYLSSSFWS